MQRKIETVLADRTAEWMGIEGVTGTAVGLYEGQPCLVVFVERDSERVRSQLPESVEGYSVDVRVSGMFRPRESP